MMLIFEKGKPTFIDIYIKLQAGTMIDTLGALKNNLGKI